MLQATDTIMYTVAAVVIYYYGGKDVKSPALSSTSPITAKIAYGIAIPTVSVTTTESFFHCILIVAPDRHRWRNQRPRCSQVSLRSRFPGNRPYAKAKFSVDWIMGGNQSRALDHRMDHCRSYTCFQQSSQPYSEYHRNIQSSTWINRLFHRRHFLRAGLLVSHATAYFDHTRNSILTNIIQMV